MTPLHIVIVQLAFERLERARDLLVRYPALTHYCTHLAQQPGVRVSVVSRFWRDEQFDEGGVSWHFCVDDATRLVAAPWTRSPAVYARVAALQPDVVHVNGTIFPRQIRGLRRRLPAETAMVVQHHGEMLSHRYVRWTPRATLHGVDGFLFTADGIADAWRAAGRIGAHQRVFAVVEASTTFVPQPREDARRETGLHGSPAVLWVGRLHARKSPLLALDAFDRSLDRLGNRPEDRLGDRPEGGRGDPPSDPQRNRLSDPQLFMIYGEEALLPEVRAFIASRPGLAARVHLIGRVEHARLAAWFSAADVFITTSPAEGSNFALIEALACGLLPVCSDNPAHVGLTRGGSTRGGSTRGDVSGSDMSREDGAGLLFPFGDAARGAEALVEAAARVAREGDAGRQRLHAYFERHLSWPAIARQAADAYRETARLRAARTRRA